MTRLLKWIFACYLAAAAFGFACWCLAMLMLHDHWVIVIFLAASIWAIPMAISHWKREKRGTQE